MKTVIKVLIALVLAAVVGVAAIAVASSNGIFLFSQALDAWESTINSDVQASVMLDDNANCVGEMWVAVDGAPNSTLNRIRIDITHYNETLLDSVTFKFYSYSGHISVYMDAGYPPMPTRSHEERGVITINLKPADNFARSTLHCDLVLEHFATDQVSLDTELTLHQPALLQLTSLKANVYLPQILPEHLQR